MARTLTNPYGGRFGDSSSSDAASGILSGINQTLDPHFNAAYVKRNLAPYKKYGLPQDPSKFKKMTDTELRALAAKAILGVNKIKPKSGNKPAAPVTPPVIKPPPVSTPPPVVKKPPVVKPPAVKKPPLKVVKPKPVKKPPVKKPPVKK